MKIYESSEYLSDDVRLMLEVMCERKLRNDIRWKYVRAKRVRNGIDNDV